jgi:rubrerythrin
MKFESPEEIIVFAIEKEKEAADFYDRVSQQQQFSGHKQMLAEFAAEERKHQRLLEGLQSGKSGKDIDDYQFRWIKDIKRSDYVVEMPYRPDMNYHELLMLAMKREEKALALYNQMLTNAQEDRAKKIFKILCQEEAKHKLALETVYDDYMAKMGD